MGLVFSQLEQIWNVLDQAVYLVILLKPILISFCKHLSYRLRFSEEENNFMWFLGFPKPLNLITNEKNEYLILFFTLPS